jgi:hypothetical protein
LERTRPLLGERLFDALMVGRQLATAAGAGDG